MERQFIFNGKSANLLCFLQLRLHLRLSFEMYELGDIWLYKPHRQKNCFLKSWLFVKREIDFLLKAQHKVIEEVSVVSYWEI